MTAIARRATAVIRASIKARKSTMFSQLKFAIILFGLTQLLRFAAWRHSHFAARLKERNLTAQIKARDEGTGRWIEFCNGKIKSRVGLHPKPDVTLFFQKRCDRRIVAYAADQLARSDQFAERFYAIGRRSRGPHELVRSNAYDEPDRRVEVRNTDAGRLHTILQHDQWRSGLYLRQGRQDRSHDADRF